MNRDDDFLLLTVGFGRTLLDKLYGPVARRSDLRFEHLVHPKYVPDNWAPDAAHGRVHFFRQQIAQSMPAADPALLASLERSDVPTVHNMILGDRVVSKLPTRDALAYMTFLTGRLTEAFEELRPDVVLTGFDSVHSALALAVAKRDGIPAYALHYSSIPQGLACFCDRMSPAARVVIRERPAAELEALAESAMDEFVHKRSSAHAYIAPPPKSVAGQLAALPKRWRALRRTLTNGRLEPYLKYTEKRNSYSVTSAVGFLTRQTLCRRALLQRPLTKEPPGEPYVLFGFHMQPESSVDVWAPFFSDQNWVAQLLSRSIPPDHRLLLKIHKSDIASRNSQTLRRLTELPGVELVEPFADTRRFLEASSLVMAIQGTMALEAALLGKPVIMLGESPVTVFPSVAPAGSLRELPGLVRRQLDLPRPQRSEILRAFARFLAPFFDASLNVWTRDLDAKQLDGFGEMFGALREHIRGQEGARQLAGQGS